MPLIRVELFAGRTPAQKRACAEALTAAAVQSLGVSADSVDVMFFDVQKSDWATAGLPWSDRAAAPAKADSPTGSPTDAPAN